MGWSLSQDVWRLVVIEGQRLPIQGNLAPLLDKCLGSPSQHVSITEVHTPTGIPAVCPKYVLKQLHIHYRLSFSKLFLTVQLCRVHPQIVNLYNCYGGLQSVGEPKCSWCIEHTHNSIIIPCMLLQVVSKLLSAISDQSICHHYSQEKIA